MLPPFLPPKGFALWRVGTYVKALWNWYRPLPHFGTPFDELPEWCGASKEPGHDETEVWRDWSTRETTADQVRIEDALEKESLDGARLLHIGVGNSGFAKRFAHRVYRIDGITLHVEELAHAHAMAAPNYGVQQRNKYHPALALALPGPYDYVIDNNPSAFACCRAHFFGYLRACEAMLAPSGRFLTDRRGLDHSVTGNDIRWRLDEETWRRIGEAIGLSFERLDDSVFALRRP